MSIEIACSVADCTRKHFAAGLCGPHYKRKWRYGDPEAGGLFRDGTIESDIARMHRFSQLTDEGCLVWIGSFDTMGYGRLIWKGKNHSSHRVMYQLVKGPIPEGLELDHLCSNKPCINPDHLEPVTHSVNLQRYYATKPNYCPHGHEYTEKNRLIDRNGVKRCRECVRANTRVQNAKRRAKVTP